MTFNKKHFLLTICLFIFLMNLKAQTAYIDSLKTEIALHPEKDTTRVRMLNDMIYEIRIYNINKADSLVTVSEYLIDSLNFTSGKAQLYYYKNFINIMKSDFAAAIDNCLKSVELYKKINHKRGIALSLNSAGIAYDYLDDFPNAIIYYEKAAVIFKEIDSKVGVAASLDNIGNIYANQGNFKEALINYKKSLSIKESLNDTAGLALVYNNIGSVYAEQSDYPRALEYFNKCLNIQDNINDEYQKMNIFDNIAYVYMYQKSYDKR